MFFCIVGRIIFLEYNLVVFLCCFEVFGFFYLVFCLVLLLLFFVFGVYFLDNLGFLYRDFFYFYSFKKKTDDSWLGIRSIVWDVKVLKSGKFFKGRLY